MTTGQRLGKLRVRSWLSHTHPYDLGQITHCTLVPQSPNQCNGHINSSLLHRGGGSISDCEVFKYYSDEGHVIR